MAWINKGDLFEVNGVNFLALGNSYATRIITDEDCDAFRAGYDMSVINNVVYAAPMKDGVTKQPYYVNLHQTRNLKIVEKAKN
jgi:hypothetical protein